MGSKTIVTLCTALALACGAFALAGCANDRGSAASTQGFGHAATASETSKESQSTGDATASSQAATQETANENNSEGTMATSTLQTMSVTVNGAAFNMNLVEAGIFTMGSDNTGVQFSESPAHEVTLTRDYLMGETEVTEDLWAAVMGGRGSGSSLPKTSVTWQDAHDFINRLNQLAHDQGAIADDRNFHLPTEAQWEFAAKGGNASQGYLYSGSDDVDEVAVTRENSGSDAPTYVKTKKPNELGLYDMSGNAYEWVEDRGGSYSADPQTDPVNTRGSLYVKRGGSNYHSFSSEPYLFTTTGRYFYGSTDWTIGFRICLY